jgi:hypothetical protein
MSTIPAKKPSDSNISKKKKEEKKAVTQQSGTQGKLNL